MRQRLAWCSARALASAPMRGYWARCVTPLIPNSEQAARRRPASSASGQTISGFQGPYAADLAGCSKESRSLSDFIGQRREKLRRRKAEVRRHESEVRSQKSEVRIGPESR